jgi:hypothetical protein
LVVTPTVVVVVEAQPLRKAREKRTRRAVRKRRGIGGMKVEANVERRMAEGEWISASPRKG